MTPLTPTYTSEAVLPGSERTPPRPGIRRYSTHLLDEWTVEIFRGPSPEQFLARLRGLPGFVGRGFSEAAAVSDLRKALAGRGQAA